MARIGYHCSHEQFAPADLLRYVRCAERAGFQGAMCSDHFHPWSDRQGESGFAWAWLGAAMQATELSFGVVNAPGQRYHPAIIAQASATLAAMFPNRFWIALGSGQLLNEHVTGEPWIAKPERQARLRECVDVIRALWAGETVSREGAVRVRDAKLFSRPEAPPRLVGAAVSAKTAEWVGSWADALITVVKPKEKLREVVDAFRRGGGEGKPMLLQAQTSYASSRDEALRAAFDQWRTNVLDSEILTELAMPASFEEAAEGVTAKDLEEGIRISADLSQHAAWIEEYVDLGFEEIYIHQVGREQERFIEAFGTHVLPSLS